MRPMKVSKSLFFVNKIKVTTKPSPKIKTQIETISSYLNKEAILGSRDNLKICGVDDAEIVGHLVAECRPFLGTSWRRKLTTVRAKS
jgi:hypothetical protein